MSWVKLDDGMPESVKVAPLSDAAFRAYVTAICYCARALTDGFVPARKAREFASGRARAVRELEEAGLWEQVEGGYQVHDYLAYNPSRAEVVAGREEVSRKRSEAGRRGAQERWQTDGKRMANGMAKPMAKRWQTAWQNDGPVPDPDPVPHKDLDQDLKPPEPERSLGSPVLPPRDVVVVFERAFGRLLSPTELELIAALAEEHPRERIEYAVRESAALSKRSLRYVQRICEREAQGGSSERVSSVGRVAGRGTDDIALRAARL